MRASPPYRRVVILNPKGGCGKSTLSTHLAAYYQNRGKATRLFDHDIQASARHWFLTREQRYPERCKNLEVVEVNSRPGAQVTRSWLLRVPPETERVVVDTPAGIRAEEMAQLLQSQDQVLIPVLPSPIDIQAASYFIRDLLLASPSLKRQSQIAVIANRCNSQTQMYHALERFLFSLKIPFLSTLHDLQVYPKAMLEGLSLHDLPNARVAKELQAWAPILRWLEPPADTLPFPVSCKPGWQNKA